MYSKIWTLLLISVFISASLCQDPTTTAAPPTPAETCTKIGTTCSSNCAQIIACTQIGQPPLFTVKDCSADSTNPSYCQESGSVATCGGTKCKSGADSIKVICGSEGRLPHPTNPTASVRCNGVNVPPSKICYCPVKQNVDVSKPGLSCSEDATAITPVKCGNQFSFGDISDSYGYICKSSSEIIVTLKESSSTSKRSLSPSLLAGAAGDCEDEAPNDQTNAPPTQSSTEPEQPSESPSPPEETSQPPTESSTVPTTQPPTQTTSKPTQPTTQPTRPTSSTTQAPPVLRCTKQFEAYPDPTDCHYYYICNDSLQPQRRKCSQGRFFYSTTKTCVPGRC